MEESCSAIISSSSAVQEDSKHQEMLSFSVLNDDTGRTEAKKKKKSCFQKLAGHSPTYIVESVSKYTL